MELNIESLEIMNIMYTECDDYDKFIDIIYSDKQKTEYVMNYQNHGIAAEDEENYSEEVK
ncbi:MAG: hypothetical protein PWQ37_2406 [Candidatus Petromonas sp.]|nr:hypothetical protein [Candidatus Petromonas sp.]